MPVVSGKAVSGLAGERRGAELSAHLAILQRYGGRHGERLVAASAAVQLLSPLAARAYRRLRRRDDFTITVHATDDLYPVLHEWVLQRMPVVERKALIAVSGSSFGGLVSSSDSPAAAPTLRLRYDGNREQTVAIEGHHVNVAVTREELPAGVITNDSSWKRYMERITFTAPTAAGRDAVVRMIEGVLAAVHEEDRPPAVFIPRWGAWQRRADLPTRTLESTILKAGQLERLVRDLADFLAAEEEYDRLSQPWHRGYLFHGAPGTGKTSVARALASHFGLPTYYLPLGDIEKDTNLMQFVGDIAPRSVLLLEDVDAYHATTSRTEEKDSVSIAAMLNALDGIWTPRGLVTILTTNHRDQIDDALLRAGRVDVDEEFTVLDADQVARMSLYFDAVSELGADPDVYVGRSPAELIEHLRRNRLARTTTEEAWR